MRRPFFPLPKWLLLFSAVLWPILGSSAALGFDASLATLDSTRAPIIMLEGPIQQLEATAAPPTVTFRYTGVDADGPTGAPTKVRYILKPALSPAGQYVSTRYAYDQYLEDLLSFADGAWTPWLPYDVQHENRRVTFPALPRLDQYGQVIYYLFAMQAIDTVGVVTTARGYGENVCNFYISTSMSPVLTIRETYLGEVQDTSVDGVYPFDIAQGQSLNFSWVGQTPYLSEVDSYRYGWDVVDPTDENDPNWAVQRGNTPAHWSAPERTFSSGVHTLTVHCWDTADQLTRITIVLSVVPVPDPADQLPLLMVDDVGDHWSNAWPGPDGTPYDRDAYRDAFWDEVLTGSGGVLGFAPGRDVVDIEDVSVFGYRQVVNYRTVIWSNRKQGGSYIAEEFDPVGGESFVWLGIYQQLVGNLLLCGQRAQNSFIGDQGMVNALRADGTPAVAAPWVTPIIFDATEEYFSNGGDDYAAGFGWRRTATGGLEMIGPTRYPYAIAGLAAIDAPSHGYLVWPGAFGVGAFARKAPCVGLKALLIDPEFDTNWGNPSALPDTVFTWRVIDFRDYLGEPSLETPYTWSLDEFYDTNVTSRPTPIVPQTLPGGAPVIEPMWRYLARFDFIDDWHALRGNPDWPAGSYTQEELLALCGLGALLPGDGTVVNGVPVGFVSHKTQATKPSQRPDVYWGFDPSRFDHTRMRLAIRWVLDEVFGLTMAP